MEDFLLIVDSHEWRRMLDFSSRIGFKINAVSPFRLLMASGRSPARTNRLLQSTCLEVKARHPRNDVGHVRLGLVRSFATFNFIFLFSCFIHRIIELPSLRDDSPKETFN